jgi:hypothetical protein
MNIFRTRTRRGAAILFSGVLVLGGLALTSEATAVKDGDNPSCRDLGYTYGQRWENPSGPYSLDRDGMTADFTVGTYYDVAAPNSNNAVTEADIVTEANGYAVVVKGGDGYNLYPNTEAVPMHAPANASGKWPTISHFDLCWNKPAPEPELGQLDVEKVVAGTDTPDEYSFEICVTPVGGGEELCQNVEGDGTLTFENLPVGDYVVTETDPGPEFEVEGSGVTVTVENDDITVTTITNTWIPPSEEFGRVEVTKVVTGVDAPADGRYEICLTGPVPSTTKECKTVVGEGKVTFEGLVPGTYTVTETEPGTEYGGPEYTATIDPATVAVTIGEVAKATVTNEYTKEESLPPTTPTTPVTPVTPTTPVAPTTPVTPTAPAAPVTPAAPAATAEVSAQTALPTTGSEGGLAAIAAVLVTAGMGLTMLSKRRGTQQA